MKILSLIALLVFSNVVFAQQMAVTDTGETVFLFKDGTWTYESESDVNMVIETNETPFEKNEDATFKVRSTVNNTSIYINPKDWKFAKSSNNPDAEYEFVYQHGDLYAMSITEEIQIELEQLADLALLNLRAFAPNAKVVNQEFRTVNGERVLHMEFQGTGNGINFSYVGYYYSNEMGSTQLVVYTSTSLVPKYRSAIEGLLNGLTANKA